ncbi:hypothetical protein DSCW_58020 [Desulfosarcina widdelii]|uniref:Uncharacterized protein n=1 Tax=Desulfosarcina widdelii TaxID=947919 RepID=A0A5K7ZC95_9BACT|nr:hypothetical protein DSCW_58020 [Desulfosarcina widdelii]
MDLEVESLSLESSDQWLNNKWLNEEDRLQFKHDKRFVRCICPKCAADHSVYMLWTGRGVPRKYCGSCKSMVSTYGDAIFYGVNHTHYVKRGGRREDG